MSVNRRFIEWDKLDFGAQVMYYVHFVHKIQMFRVRYRVSEAYYIFCELIYSTVVSYGNNFINVLPVEVIQH
jgi:hypothetical protein